MTLLENRNKKGRLLGRCDERCYDAMSDKCNCICGGKNHGVGRVQAVKNIHDEYGIAYQDDLFGRPVVQKVHQF